MEIIHQLPGRVRIRIPALESQNYCQRVVEGLVNDERIKDLRINSACISLTVHYDPMRIEIKDVLDLLGEKKPVKQLVASKKPGAADKKIKPVKAKRAVRATKKIKKGTAAAKHFKPAVSAGVQEKIGQIIKREDPQRPYSDSKVSALLKEENIEIARRTVAKYREIMGILPSNQRKH